jgi:MATE family multidrug resistance protein
MISYTWNCIVINTICICNKSFNESFFWFTSESYKEGMAEYLKVGIPSAVMLCLEWGAFELLALTSSLISVDATGAQIIAYNAYLVFMMIPWGGQVGTIVCVGKAMGEGNSVKARTLLKVATLFMFLIDSLMCVLIIINTDALALFFTSNEEVLKHLHPTFLVMAIQLLFQGIHVVSGGGLKALGLQSKASVIVLVSQYLGTIPFGYLFAIVLERGIVGIWEGLILGGIVQMFLFLYVLRF